MLTGLELTFMVVTRANSGLFSTPGFVVSPVGKGEREKKKRREGGEKEIEKERKEGRRNRNWRQDKKEF